MTSQQKIGWLILSSTGQFGEILRSNKSTIGKLTAATHYFSSTPNCCFGSGAWMILVGTGVGLFFASRKASYLEVKKTGQELTAGHRINP